MKKNCFLLCMLIAATLSVKAQPKFPDLVLKLDTDKTEVEVGDIITLTITGEIPKDYAIYSSNIKCEIGPLPPEMEISDTSILKPFGTFTSIGDKIEMDEIFNCQVGKFTKHVNLTQKVKVLKVGDNADVTFSVQMCSDKTGICLMMEKKFSIELKTPDAPKAEDKSEYIKSNTEKGIGMFKAEDVFWDVLDNIFSVLFIFT